MNRVYMTFLTNDYLRLYPWLEEAEGSALTRFVVSYIVTDDIITGKIAATREHDKGYSIRPVIKSDVSLIPFIEKHRTNKGDLDFKNISLGTYPLQWANDLLFLKPQNCVKTGKQRTVVAKYKIAAFDEYTYKNRNFIIVGNKPLEILPLEWEYNDAVNILICKSRICEYPYSAEYTNKGIHTLLSYIYMNFYLFKELLSEYEIESNNNIELVSEKDGVSFSYPYKNFIEMDDDGNIVCHDVKSYKLTIPKGVKKLKNSAISSIVDGENYNLNLDIDIDGTDLKIGLNSLSFAYADINATISNLTVHNITKSVEECAFSCHDPIDNITIPCDFTLFSRLYLSGYELPKNLFENSNFTLAYTSEKELINFFNDVNRFLNLIIKSYRQHRFGLPGEIDFTYKHNCYRFNDAFAILPNNVLLDNRKILSILKVNSFTLKGPKISKKLITELFFDFPLKTEFTDLARKEDNTKQIKESKDKKEEPKLSKEAEHILDLAREIMSIDYIGLDKEDVRNKVNVIIDEYNTSYVVEENGLSLSTNNGLYTNTIIKLENLRDTLYHNFEKNLEFYDILDLIESMINKLNGGEVKIDYEILKDLDTLTKIIKYSKDEQTKIELITYLENEKQNIIDYLCGKKEMDYKNINDFIKKFRLYLMPILTKVSGNVSKIDVIKQIKNYALSEMNDKVETNTNSYIKVILSEINKLKQDIIKLDENYTFEELDYSDFASGKEIIDYLDNLYIKYYKDYTILLNKKQKYEDYQSNMIPKIY